jgi:hypothetical protein
MRCLDILTQNPEARDCLRELFLTDPFEDKNSLKRKKGGRAAGTCEWILGTEELTVWLATSQAAGPESPIPAVLWLYGNPGTGKSTMAISLVEQLAEIFATTQGRTLAYFFCDSNFDTRKTATSIVRGLILQLLQQHPPLLEYVLPKHLERGAKVFESFEALWTIFTNIGADKNTGRKYCIIDALDECDPESQEMLLGQLNETFGQHSSSDLLSNIRILITSRPYREIRESLEPFAKKDLASFIDEKVEDLKKRKQYTNSVKDQVTRILRDKAGGTGRIGLCRLEQSSFERCRQIPPVTTQRTSLAVR